MRPREGLEHMVGGQLLEGGVHLYSFWAVIILAGVGFSVMQLSEDDIPIRNPSKLTGSPCRLGGISTRVYLWCGIFCG